MSKKNITGIKLTTTHIVIIATNSGVVLLPLARPSSGGASIGNGFAPVLRAAEFLLRFAGAAGALVDAGATALGHAEELADLEEVGLHGVDEALGLAVFARRADGDAAVFDDVANAEAFP